MSEFKHDESAKQYQVKVAPDKWAHLDYSEQGNTRVITHTFVPPELRGKGCGKVLMETVLQDFEKQNLKVAALCSYADIYLTRNRTKWQHIIA